MFRRTWGAPPRGASGGPARERAGASLPRPAPLRHPSECAVPSSSLVAPVGPEPVDQNASVATTGHPVLVAGVVTVCVTGPAATETCDAARTCSDTRPWVFVQPWVFPK